VRDTATSRTVTKSQEDLFLDGMLYNGKDELAERRAHIRGLTMARQAAERIDAETILAARRTSSWLNFEVRTAAREARADAELAEAEHRAWLYRHSPQVTERRKRTRRQGPRTPIETPDGADGALPRTEG